MSKEKRTVVGHMDCPTCKTPGGVRVTLDKNGEPFGYCEAKCHQQLRIGGDAYRVACFKEAHPDLWARVQAAKGATVTGTGTDPAPAAKPAPAAVAPVPAPAQKRDPRPTGAGFFDQLMKGG